MDFLHPERDKTLELALEDVFLVPRRFDGTSRLDVELCPDDFPGGSHPVVSSNMNAVTGKRMAETMARYGGLGILPQDMELGTVKRIVDHIKGADPRFDTALSVKGSATVRDVLGIIWKRSHHLVVVVDESDRPIGVVKPTDLRGRDQYTRIDTMMSAQTVTVPVGISNHDAFLVMDEHRVNSVPVVTVEGRLLGVLTKADVVRLELLKPTVTDEGKLMVACAVGISSDAADTAKALVDMGVSVLVLDTAHGHQRRMLETLRAVRSVVGDQIPLVAGNVCTAEGTRDLIEAGADVVKVNVGPGAMCLTRMQTGVGRPTFSSVLACAHEARKHGKHVWADGGVKHPRDVALYMAAGASRVMLGSVLAATYESPGDLHEDHDGRTYKENWGMASARAVSDRTSGLDEFERAKKGFFREGVSHSRVYFRPGRESVSALLTEYITGLQSAFTYAGARSVPEFRDRALVGVQSMAGFTEGQGLSALFTGDS